MLFSRSLIRRTPVAASAAVAAATTTTPNTSSHQHNHNNRSKGGHNARPSGPDLEGLRVAAFVDSDFLATATSPLLEGKVSHRIHDNVYAVEVPVSQQLSPVLEIGCRVLINYDAARPSASSTPTPQQHTNSSGGMVVRVNPTGTVFVLLDNNRIDMAVPPRLITLVRSSAHYKREKDYLDVVDWVRTAGVVRRRHQEDIAMVLFQRRWRVEKLYLLEGEDVHCMTFIPKSVRMRVLDKSEWQRDHHRQMRQLLKERVKERDFRYRLTKYSGVVSASMAFLGIAIAFAWNVKNYHYQQRKYQLATAADTFVKQHAKKHHHHTHHLESKQPPPPPQQQQQGTSSAAGATTTSSSTTTTSSSSSSSTTTSNNASREQDRGLQLLRQQQQQLLEEEEEAEREEAEAEAEAAEDGEDDDDTSMTLREQHFVHRASEEHIVTQVLQQLDTSHPRIVVLTGRFGCGKSTVCRAAIAQTDHPAVQVDLRGKEDSLRSIVKALGVQNVDVCGDLLDFVADACRETKKQIGVTPLLVLKLRGPSTLSRVYNEAVTLACDRRVCHIVIEVPMESLTMANTSLPRLDFYTVPTFSRAQAFEYTQHTVDPVSLQHFVETIGTNSNDLDELFAAVNQRSVSSIDYTNQKTIRAMRQVQSACIHRPQLREALTRLAAFPYDVGQHTGVDTSSLRSADLRDIVLYDPVQDVWVFRTKALHTATRCCWLGGAAAGSP